MKIVCIGGPWDHKIAEFKEKNPPTRLKVMIDKKAGELFWSDDLPLSALKDRDTFETFEYELLTIFGHDIYVSPRSNPPEAFERLLKAYADAVLKD